MTLPPVLDVDTAAQLLRCEPSTVRERLRQGDLPGVKLGTDWVLPAGALLQRLDELALEESARRRAPTPAPQAVALRPVPGKAPRRPPVLPVLPALPAPQPLTKAEATDLVGRVVSTSARPIGMVEFGMLVVRSVEAELLRKMGGKC